jgi:hypothetical protein
MSSEACGLGKLDSDALGSHRSWWKSRRNTLHWPRTVPHADNTAPGSAPGCRPGRSSAYACLRCSWESARVSPARRTRARTYRPVRRLVVDVHERALDVREDLDLVLQLLADVVRLPQRRRAVHDDVDLDEVVRAALRASARCGSEGAARTWYARTVSICVMCSLNVEAL